MCPELYGDWSQSTFLKIFKCSRFSQFDSKVIENSLFEVLMMVFS